MRRVEPGAVEPAILLEAGLNNGPRPGSLAAGVSSARSAVDADAVSDSAREPRGDLLYEPGIAVGIIEGAERPVASALGVGARLPCLDRERRAVPDIAGVDATAGEFVVGRYDVGDGQPALGRARRGRGESGAERDRGPGARGRELDDAKAL